jgi:hypothetical protein
VTLVSSHQLEVFFSGVLAPPPLRTAPHLSKDEDESSYSDEILGVFEMPFV